MGCVVFTDLDRYRSARIIIDQFGDNARLEAARCADAQLTQGNLEGAEAWLAIAYAIKELQRTRRYKNEALH